MGYNRQLRITGAPGFTKWLYQVVVQSDCTMTDISILVVDDQHLVRAALARMLEDMDGFHIAGEADSGEEAIDLVKALKPDVVLMDVRMPGIGGIGATKSIVRSAPETKVLAVTGCGENPFPQRLLDGGASGFITKDADIDEMVEAIRAVASGKRYISKQVAQEMAMDNLNGGTDSPFDKLSERELQTSLMVIEGIKTTEIADKLNVSYKTVNTYRYRVFNKLKINSDMELAMLAVKHGVINAEEMK